MSQNVYHFDQKTKAYEGLNSPLELDPIEQLPLLPRWSTLTPPPAAGANQVPVMVGVDTWELHHDYRDQVFYDAAGIKKVITDLNVEPDPSWTTVMPFIFSGAMAEKLDEIQQKAYHAFSQITSGYLQPEIDTFPTQKEEAAAWRNDNNTVTPMLDGIVANRPGVTKSLLVARILDVNAPLYIQASAIVMGKKQHLEDVLYALQAQHEDPMQADATQSDIDAIAVDFS